MKVGTLLLFIFMAILSHICVWLQNNLQFIDPKFKTHTFWIILAGIPISWFWIKTTEYGVKAFDGKFWPQRFIAFAAGMFIYTILTQYFFAEKLELKSIISLLLATTIVGIQIFWK